VITFAEWAAQLRLAAAECRPALEATLFEEMQRLGDEAAGMPGRPQPEWPDLAPATLADKARRGYPIPAPLLRTGEFRQSIFGWAEGLIGAIGSDDPKSVYSEFGTSREPPRPVFSATMVRALPQLETTFGILAQRLLARGR
jgi:hypothetical protein